MLLLSIVIKKKQDFGDIIKKGAKKLLRIG